MNNDSKTQIKIVVLGCLVVLLMYQLSKKPKPLIRKILFVGDSNTVANFSYANKIKQSHPDLTVKIIAENGKNTSWMLSKLKSELSKEKYDVVSILGGSNDIYGGLPFSVTKSNLLEMEKLIKSNHSIPIFVSPPSKSFYVNKTPAKELALKNLIDWMNDHRFDNLIDFNSITNFKNLFSPSDGYLHPQAKAHVELANNFTKKVDIS